MLRQQDSFWGHLARGQTRCQATHHSQLLTGAKVTHLHSKLGRLMRSSSLQPARCQTLMLPAEQVANTSPYCAGNARALILSECAPHLQSICRRPQQAHLLQPHVCSIRHVLFIRKAAQAQLEHAIQIMVSSLSAPLAFLQQSANNEPAYLLLMGSYATLYMLHLLVPT